MGSIITGNSNKELTNNPERKGWIIGHFIDPSSLLKSDDLEIKWGVHKAGEKFNIQRKNKKAKSLAILIDGKFKFTFPDSDETYFLENRGDFIFWDSGIYHTTECQKDSVIITIRWPSLPNDVMSK